MASSFPPKDGVPPPKIPSNPPNHSLINEDATQSIIKVPDESGNADAQRHVVDVTESLEREMIKQRIRAEIMAEELARRRILEQEIRMELMLEKEMPMRRIESTASRFDSHPGASQFLLESSIIPHSLGYPLGRRLPLPSTMPLQREVGFPGSETLPFQRHPMAALSEPRKETVLLAKPEKYFSGLKQNAPISVADHHGANCTGSEKKRKGIIGLVANPFTNVTSNKNGSIDTSPPLFSCDVCNIQLHSLVSLNEHIGGRKHKANEIALAARVQVNGESALESDSNHKRDREAQLETTPVEKQSKKQKIHENADSTPNSMAKALSSNENGKSEQLTPNPEVEATPNTKAKVSSPNEGGMSTPARGTDNALKYWCEICQVGTHTLRVLADHETGKKHKRNLRRFEEAAGVVQPTVHDEVKNLETQMSD